jgi:hypothetical protein
MQISTTWEGRVEGRTRPCATLRCPLPDREGEREGGGGNPSRSRRYRRRRCQTAFAGLPPQSQMGAGRAKTDALPSASRSARRRERRCRRRGRARRAPGSVLRCANLALMRSSNRWYSFADCGSIWIFDACGDARPPVKLGDLKRFGDIIRIDRMWSHPYQPC